MITKALPREDWQYIEQALLSRARRQASKRRNAQRKDFAPHLLQILDQDAARATTLAKVVAP